MMVTFVSECEKKALNRTRRVLDAFANRIGSRTWQTVITEEGLQAVKKLLRKSATKNTAVSCHWIRSRSRSELLWVVGNKEKFNDWGYVPVNYTEEELIMDESQFKTDKILANTKRQPLYQHLFAVGFLAYQLVKQLVNDDKLAKAACIAGCMHDSGKVEPGFQDWLANELKKKTCPDEIPEEGQHIDKKTGKFSFEKHPTHNEVSLLLFQLLNQDDCGNKESLERVAHVIYWHHAKPLRNPKNDHKKLITFYDQLKNNIGEQALNDVCKTMQTILKRVNYLASQYLQDDRLEITLPKDEISADAVDDLERYFLPEYKIYSSREKVADYKTNILKNAKNNLARTAIITADRLVSALSAEELAQHLEEKTLEQLMVDKLEQKTDLSRQIEQCLQQFKQMPNADSERNKQQAIAARKLAETIADESNVKVLQGPAGCGKTKIALEWALNTDVQRILWICPRVQVCQGLYHDLMQSEYLPDSTIEIFTGEFKLQKVSGKEQETDEKDFFTGDIVITTIDQLTNAIITHRQVTNLVDFMTAHIVFDEFHEYINMPAFNLLFAELVKCKALQYEQGKALLVSATPNYYFVREFLDIQNEDIVSVPSFNQSRYKIVFESFEEKTKDESNSLYRKQPAQTFVISNTATTAQLSFIHNQQQENALLLHSKFTNSDKKTLFQKTIEQFGQQGQWQYDLLRSGPIVQAALNISCRNMISEFTHAENWLQRMGRLNRFAEHTEVCQYTIAIPNSLAQSGKQQSACARFLNRLHSLQSAKAWNEFLQDKLDNNEEVTLTKLYDLYRQFYGDKTSLKAIEQDFIQSLKTSVQVLESKLMDPVRIRLKKESPVKIKKHSLRGDNRFVQMAVCEVKGFSDKNFLDQYAVQEPGELTAPVDEICGYGDSKQNLLSFMAKKHHNIVDGVKKSYNDKVLINEARDPEKPVYLSYTPFDLKKVEAQPHPFAIYYAQGIKQPIGAISIKQFNDED
ncbi:CRISPR-associated endonuclease Cas3'' [methane-oxidizing endosymbiont of Gigantopelta aegis]|uniref:CRISPR-associated endonuclease Cas3'' n=1 Tax=methane-oxidizing endosymbiont of Gigantopelta aegis TaxID=2794938 RepID=UPI0018DBC609|nr:CRISPR-associated endonuclease Cas3'' [methane-oxidizing endosymbiont of Gigantopelta aegis]